ncbi:hypothetical protein PHPALM_30418 [Phytophthora palmivora]|uniref:PiggyBac transposable element-derived protein domain-containing protein n=1 Tax=Phytophthora palmivora TaxID=4796 RepID=A0A2P4X565_9STRA|nr:hypothetical protein PHPALM_30418 [Phytophthora palmivora]
MIPSRSRHNVTRQYMKDKPHKWDQHESELGGGSPSKYSADPNSGPAAVVRNLHEVLPPPEPGVFHTVVTDRYYTSVQLALQLLHRNVYSIGTIQANKAGFPKEVTAEYATRPRDIPRGYTKMAIMKNVPQMTSLLWWDRVPVQFLATGASRTMQTCGK